MRETISLSSRRPSASPFVLPFVWGELRAVRLDTGEVLWREKNLIVNSAAQLIANLFSSSTSVLAAVWGLSVGAGGTGAAGWSATTQPDPQPTVYQPVSEIKRKPLSQIQYVDSSGNPTSTVTTDVVFETVLNATTDNIAVPIREMGLIGGGISSSVAGGPTDMLSAAYFNPASPSANAVYLINYKTLPSFILPPGINIAIDWKLSFA